MLHLFDGLDFSTSIFLVLALLFVFFYEAINGFHDTANAVATVIYTRAMRAQSAVIMAGIFNFFGVLLGGLTVAYTIIHMLPIDLLVNVSCIHSLAMVFSMLSAAIIWNLSTWYLGLPASSSHTLIASIIGIGLTNVFINQTLLFDALNLSKIMNVFFSLILSPIVGLLISGSLIFLLRRYCNGTKKCSRIHMTPADREKIDGKKKPPFWIRIALIFSSLGVSYSHGANDGQKGIGLIMLVLIGVTPAGFVVNMNASGYDITRTRDAVNHLEYYYRKNQKVLKHIIKISPYMLSIKKEIQNSQFLYCNSKNLLQVINNTQNMLSNLQNYGELSIEQRSDLRRSLLFLSDTVDKVTNFSETNNQDKIFLNKLKNDLLDTIEYAPMWIIVAIAQALGIGTMIGWRRVAITIGEKIGKKNMTYAQGMSAQLTAALSIGIASYTGMPVSTTHILSSSVAGAMLVDGGRLQSRTLKNIAVAWIFTLPVCIVLSGSLYWIALKFI
ncbi:inorganic phosphate transporter PitA [Candidatus Pantoea carbekii]|uniref:Phosphate transporter n=1 Tax=Candidatus Pantoea carbekii TaxID=1235990 RepID=U3U761_9GAMM|nr:inorganic phosphate transporter PitA [Candidatus Pantoea carbekii]BAO00177.1 PitA protein [Candidatus Pantoea carbekii]